MYNQKESSGSSTMDICSEETNFSVNGFSPRSIIVDSYPVALVRRIRDIVFPETVHLKRFEESETTVSVIPEKIFVLTTLFPER